MATPTIAMKKANTLMQKLVEFGFFKKIAPGRFLPVVVKRCGTCQHFTPPVVFLSTVGKCNPINEKRDMRQKCGNHQFTPIYQFCIDRGLK